VSYLHADGRLVTYFGARRLDEITAPMLREWWNVEVTGRGVTVSTGRNYLSAIAGVLGYAVELGLLAESPEAVAFVLLQLDAGLRMGEALGLRWGAITWGSDESDRTRSLHVVHNRPRGGEESAPKSGRSRRVALSRRLRAVLLDLYRKRFEPGPEALVFPGIDPANWRKRDWRRITKRAGLSGVAIKDLRDTYASWLLTCTGQLAYVSRQLGHGDVATTSRHYARWCGGDDYREPMHLAPGEVPADLLARLLLTREPHLRQPPAAPA
jgi:integrase